MDPRYRLAASSAIVFNDAESGLVYLYEKGIQSGVLLDREYPDVRVHFDLENGQVRADVYEDANRQNAINYSYSEYILRHLCEPPVSLGVLAAARVMLLDELQKLNDPRLIKLIRDRHMDGDKHVNVALDPVRKTIEQIHQLFKLPLVVGLFKPNPVSELQETIVRITSTIDLAKITSKAAVMIFLHGKDINKPQFTAKM